MKKTYILFVVLAGCGSTQQADQTAKSVWVGRPADEFFAKYGPPKLHHQMAAGGRVYEWESVAQPSLIDQKLTCSANLVTDSKGRLTDITFQQDSIGVWNVSRCTELLNR